MRSNGTSVEARVALRERMRPGAAFLIEGTADDNANVLNGRRDRRGGEAMIPLAEVGFTEATWIMVVKSLLIFLVVFMIVPVLTVVERKLIGRFQNRYGPNRVGPVGLLQPLADIVKLAGKELFRPDAAVPLLLRDRPGAGDLLRDRDPGDHPLRRRPGRGRPLRDRRLDRRPLLLRLRLALVLRPAARRLVLGLEVQLPRRDALGRAADLLRGLDGPLAARRDHDGRLAVADLDRRGAGRGLVHRPPVRRLPRSS